MLFRSRHGNQKLILLDGERMVGKASHDRRVKFKRLATRRRARSHVDRFRNPAVIGDGGLERDIAARKESLSHCERMRSEERSEGKEWVSKCRSWGATCN